MKSWWRQYAEAQGNLSGKGSWARQAADALGATGTGSYAKRIANNVGPYGTEGSHERQMVSSKTGSGSWIRQAVENAPTTGAPINTIAPAISGTATVGQTLTSSQGTWDANGGTISGYAYQWKRDGSAISGATSSTYTLVTADAGATITCTVTATNEYGSTSATSSGVGPVASGATTPSLLRSTAAQSIPNTTETVLQFGNEYAAGSFRGAGAPTYGFIVPSGVTQARITAALDSDANSALVSVRLYRTDTTPEQLVLAAQEPAYRTINVGFFLDTGAIPVTEGATYELRAYQSSGASLEYFQNYPTLEQFAMIEVL